MCRLITFSLLDCPCTPRRPENFKSMQNIHGFCVFCGKLCRFQELHRKRSFHTFDKEPILITSKNLCCFGHVNPNIDYFCKIQNMPTRTIFFVNENVIRYILQYVSPVLDVVDPGGHGLQTRSSKSAYLPIGHLTQWSPSLL